MKSQVHATGWLQAIPDHTFERIYMQKFFQKDGLPESCRRWQDTVDTMLDGVKTDGPIYLMVDQGLVKKGGTLRRPGPHIDGHWIEGDGHHGHISAHGNPGHGAPTYPDRHREPSRHSIPYNGKELIIMASNHYGCDALVGDYSGEFGEDGDCSAMDLSALKRVPMEGGYIWRGDVFMVHEAIAMQQDCARTVVRLNVPGVGL